MSDLLLFIVAIIPVVVLIILIYFADKIEKEPLWLVAALLGLGTLSTIPAAIVELIGGVILDVLFGSFPVIESFLMYFFVVAVAEELFKFLFMFAITWKSRHFDYVFDGVIYAVSSSLGFALLENIMYVFMQKSQLGFLAGMGTGVGRAFLAVPLHTSVAIFMGMFYGKAKEATFRHDFKKCAWFITLSLVVPMLIHGFYDFCLDSSNHILMMVVFYTFVVGLYAFTIWMCISFSKHDHNITGRLKVNVTKDGWLRYAITDQREIMILGLTKPFQGEVLEIPEKIDGFPVRVIARSAFAYTNIVDVRLPENLRLIEDTAFFNCPYLRNISLPDHLIGIGNFAFEYCYNLHRFLIPHVQFLGNHLFDGCNQLTDIYYLGTPEEWSRIRFDQSENQKVFAARFYYNTVRQ